MGSDQIVVVLGPQHRAVKQRDRLGGLIEPRLDFSGEQQRGHIVGIGLDRPHQRPARFVKIVELVALEQP